MITRPDPGQSEPARAPRRSRPPRRSVVMLASGCRGWSVGVYHPDLDPGRHAARQIVNFLAEVIGQCPDLGQQADR